MNHLFIRMLPLLLAAVFGSATAFCGVRIKDIADIKGVRANQLVGYGLVMGLDGTGDGNKSVFTIRSIAGMLEKMGMTVAPGQIKVKNTAAVMVTADLPPFARPGGRISVTVSSIGDAKSLQGGTLIFTPLKGADGRIYAIAQGPVSVGGFSASGAGGQVQKNFLTVGRVPQGALIEREVPSDFAKGNRLTLMLKQPDFTTAARVAEAVDGALSRKLSSTPDPGTVHVAVPEHFRENLVRFVTLVEALEVSPDVEARVIINERTGTVVLGNDVRISNVAIAHGNLSIQIRDTAAVSQPPPFSDGATVLVPDTDIMIREEDNRLMMLNPGATIHELVRALNTLGVTPRDLIAILQAIKAAGALQAQLEII